MKKQHDKSSKHLEQVCNKRKHQKGEWPNCCHCFRHSHCEFYEKGKDAVPVCNLAHYFEENAGICSCGKTTRLAGEPVNLLAYFEYRSKLIEQLAVDINETHIACVEDGDNLYEGKFIDQVRAILKTNIK